jgi:2-phosphoglycerate kinase
MVKKKSGRLEPFDSKKMARATSRAGVPFTVALDISKTIKDSRTLAGRKTTSSLTLRRMVARELRARNQDTIAKSYLGYKKTKSVREKIDRSRVHAAKVRKTTRTHPKKAVREKDILSGTRASA